MQNGNLKLGKYSVGTGDRFAHQAKAQLQACVDALSHGVEIIPVWNKSNREHNDHRLRARLSARSSGRGSEGPEVAAPLFCGC